MYTFGAICRLFVSHLNQTQGNLRTHPIDILDERTHNPIHESLFIELSPIDPHSCVLWEVMHATIGALVVSIQRILEPHIHGEVGFIIRAIWGGGKGSDVAPRVTPDELK